MNLIILEPHQFLDSHTALLSERQHLHVITVLKPKVGDTVTVGILNGMVGTAHIIELNNNGTKIRIQQCHTPPPAGLPVTVILGLPRPRMLQRTLQTIATMGVEKLCLIQSNRVEKSFWQTPLLKPESVHEQLLIGLEQGKATQLPIIEYHQRFKPYVEDVLPSQIQNFDEKLIAHPGDYPIAQSVHNRKTLLAIGPEGGFIAPEVEFFTQLGFSPIQLGERILRVETAIPVLLAKLF